MHVKGTLVVVLVASYYSEVKEYLCYNSIADLLTSLVSLLYQSKTLLKGIFCGYQISQLQVAVTELVADIDEQDWFVKDYLGFYLALHAFKLLNRFANSIAVHKALGKTRSGLDVIINAKLERRTVQFTHQESFLASKLSVLIIDLATSSLEVPEVV